MEEKLEGPIIKNGIKEIEIVEKEEIWKKKKKKLKKE